MSERIDELVARDERAWSLIRGTLDAAAMSPSVRQSAVAAANDSRKYRSQLATIAREAEANAKGQEANAVFALQLKRDAEERALKAEAMCEWLAGELYDEDYLGLYTRAARTSENEPYTPSDRVADIATIVATARAAIEQEEAVERRS